MKKKTKTNGLLITACVLSYVSVLLSMGLAIFLMFNIAGLADLYKELLQTYMPGYNDASSDLTLYIVELALVALLNLYFANFYLKGLRYRVDSPQYGRMILNHSLFQMLFASFLAGIFAMISAVVMGRKKPVERTNKQEENPYLSEYKIEAMSDAVRRLKELKAKGAISEEEYYASLNKILEN